MWLKKFVLCSICLSCVYMEVDGRMLPTESITCRHLPGAPESSGFEERSSDLWTPRRRPPSKLLFRGMDVPPWLYWLSTTNSIIGSASLPPLPIMDFPFSSSSSSWSHHHYHPPVGVHNDLHVDFPVFENSYYYSAGPDPLLSPPYDENDINLEGEGYIPEEYTEADYSQMDDDMTDYDFIDDDTGEYSVDESPGIFSDWLSGFTSNGYDSSSYDPSVWEDWASEIHDIDTSSWTDASSSSSSDTSYGSSYDSSSYFGSSYGSSSDFSYSSTGGDFDFRMNNLIK